MKRNYNEKQMAKDWQMWRITKEKNGDKYLWGFFGGEVYCRKISNAKCRKEWNKLQLAEAKLHALNIIEARIISRTINQINRQYDRN